METAYIHADAPGAIAQAVQMLAAGGVAALPTETVYGLAADAGDARAVSAVFEAKERPFFDPLIVHLPAVDWIERLALVPDEQREMVARLTAEFWPGPLTILLPRRLEMVPDLVTAGSPLVALRISGHPVFRAVIESFGRPLAAPSANRFGRISPTTGAHALSELAGRIPLVLEAGPTAHGLESTIISPESGGGLRVLRHGPIPVETLADFGRVTDGVGAASQVRLSAPGQTEGHYAPRTALTLLASGAPAAPTGGRTGLLAFRRDDSPSAAGFERVEYLSEGGDLREAAARLFAALRRLDEAGLDAIFAEPVPEIGLGRAIMERLGRAATGSRLPSK